MALPDDPQIEAVRRFNRLYTQRIGVLREGLLDSPYTLTEVRILYEIAHRTRPVAAELAAALGLDAGYLSRLMARFRSAGLVEARVSKKDGRERVLSLTPKGREAVAELEARSCAEAARLLDGLPPAGRARFLSALGTVESLLTAGPEAAGVWVLRPPEPGDLGWVVESHGRLYGREYRWNAEFEALVAEIVAGFVRDFDPARERCWIAERDGERAGSVFVVRESEEVAKLRLLLIEPWARGAGLGGRLVEEALRFARMAGYRRMRLWTNANLHAARRLYERAGFVLESEEPHHSFGHDLLGQIWTRDLTE